MCELQMYSSIAIGYAYGLHITRLFNEYITDDYPHNAGLLAGV